MNVTSTLLVFACITFRFDFSGVRDGDRQVCHIRDAFRRKRILASS